MITTEAPGRSLDERVGDRPRAPQMARGRRCRGCRSAPARAILAPENWADRPSAIGRSHDPYPCGRPDLAAAVTARVLCCTPCLAGGTAARWQTARFVDKATAPRTVSASLPAMEKSLFRYIWRHSKRDQLIVCRGRSGVAAVLFRLARPAAPDRQRGDPGQSLRATATRPRRFSSSPSGCRTGSAARHVSIFEGFQVGRLDAAVRPVGRCSCSSCSSTAPSSTGSTSPRARSASACCGGCASTCSPWCCGSRRRRLRTVKSSETATIIKDEVEPIGGFIGDAFITAGLPRHAGR